MSDATGYQRIPLPLRVGGSLLAVLSLVFLGSRLIGQIRQLPPVRWSGMAVGAVVAVIGLVVSIEAVHSLAWRTLARGVQPGTTWRESFIVCGRSQIAKYLPGNAFHYVQRVVLARGTGIGVLEASILTVVDVVLLAVAGALIGLPALGHGLRSAVRLGNSILAAVAIVSLAALVSGAVVLALPGARERLRQAARVLAPDRLIIAALLDVVPLVLAGLTVHLLLHGLWPGVSRMGWLDFVPGFSLAFVVGFVTPGAPGGIGVREMILYALYAPALGGALTASLFLLLRVTYIVGDIATFLVASSIQTAHPGRSGARADTS